MKILFNAKWVKTKSSYLLNIFLYPTEIINKNRKGFFAGDFVPLFGVGTVVGKGNWNGEVPVIHEDFTGSIGDEGVFGRLGRWHMHSRKGVPGRSRGVRQTWNSALEGA